MSQYAKSNLLDVWNRIAPTADILKLPARDDGFRPASDGSPIYVPESAKLEEPILFSSLSPYTSYSYVMNYVASGIDLAETPAITINEATFAALKNADPHKVSRRVPDAVEVITAWRAWGLRVKKSGMCLKSLGQDSTWKPKQMMTAKCGTSDNHLAPDNGCSCGIWGFKTEDVLLSAIQGKYKPSVLGRVSLWGRVIETENGFRAQFAYPKELWLFDNSLEELGYIYGVPVRTV